MTNISRAAQDALLAARNRAGSPVTAEEAQLAHLKQEGLVSRNGNLTAKGHIERMKIARRREDEAFG